MKFQPHELAELEPAALITDANNDPDISQGGQQRVISLSRAISLRRIADALDRLDPVVSLNVIANTPLNSYGETLGNVIQNQIARGKDGIVS